MLCSHSLCQAQPMAQHGTLHETAACRLRVLQSFAQQRLWDYYSCSATSLNSKDKIRVKA